MNIIEAIDWLKAATDEPHFIKQPNSGMRRAIGLDPGYSSSAVWLYRGEIEEVEVEAAESGVTEQAFDIDEILATDWIKCDRHGEPLP
jgi:hypothetical protein